MQSISFQPSSITKGTLMNNSQMINLHSSLQLQQLDISSRFCESDDSELLVVLDRLILYLRIVHSVDFYAPAFYMNEDLMPHPCRLIHIRPGLNEITKALTQVKSPEKLINSESVDHVNILLYYILFIHSIIVKFTKCLCIMVIDIEEIIDSCFTFFVEAFQLYT